MSGAFFAGLKPGSRCHASSAIVGAVLVTLVLGGCHRAPDERVAQPHAANVPAGAASTPAYLGAAYAQPAASRPAAADLAALGRALFFDGSLSASGRQSCASCHDPAFGHAPGNAEPVQLAGADGRSPGVRTVPSLRYLQTVPPFSEHHHENEGDDSIDAGPTGGRTWDGRASSAHEQASLPLLSAAEMANASAAAVVGRLRQAAYAPRFEVMFGRGIFDRPGDAFAAATMALEVYQEQPAEFQPFSSRYDAALRGQAQLSASEARGLAAFNDPVRGNCAACHPSEPSADGAFPLFTDFGFAALGVPRNPAIAANADPRYFDLGLCGPWRRDLAEHPEYCGLFRVPSLRNVAVRKSFFHNGAVHRLADAVRFYAARDRRPGRWYPRSADGTPRRFDDLPEPYRANVNAEPPFGRSTPALSEADVRDIVAFLETLTDADVAAAQASRPAAAARLRR